MNKGNKKVICGIAAVVVIVAVVLVVMLARPKTMSIAPTDYVKVRCSGLNGEGKASLVFDADSFLSAVKAEKELKPAQESEIEGLLSKAEQYFSLSKNAELTNGDEISIACDMPSDFLKSYNITLKTESYQYTVAGLTDVQTVDLKDYTVAEFGGFEGHGYISYTLDYEKMYQDVSEMVRKVEDSENTKSYIEDELYRVLYQCISGTSASKTEGLSNGDAVTLTYTVNENCDRIEEYGILFASAEKEVTVEGLLPVETVKLEDYLVAQFSGYDGAGELQVWIDEEKMREDLSEKIEDMRNGYTVEDVVYQIRNYLNYNFDIGADKTEDITNGEEIRIFAQKSGEESYVSGVGIELEDTEKTITAEGLEEPQEVDLMDLLTVSFSGICPDVDVEVEVDEENPLYSYLDRSSYYNIPSSVHAHNGDMLDITLEYREEEALKAGYRVTNHTGSYEISGLDSYDFVVESMEEEGIQAIAAQGKEEVKQSLLENEGELLESLNRGNGLILWNQVKVGLNKMVKVYADRAYYDFNTVAMVYEALVPIMGQDETITQNRMYVVTHFENVTQTVDGSLNFGERDHYSFYYSAESMQEELEQMPDGLSREEDSECEQTEICNEKIEEELKFDESSIPVQQSREVAFPAENAALPEISAEVSASAAAVIAYDGHRYYRFDTPVTWKEAKALCEKAGGQLACVTSWTQQSILQDLIAEGSLNDYWIGATDEELEGSWIWVTGEAVQYDGFSDSQPDNYNGTEHYACISRSYSSLWNDAENEAEGFGYILEIPAEEQDGAEYLAANSTLLHQSNVSYDAWDDNSYGDRSYGVIAYNASRAGWTQYELNGAYDQFSGELSVYADAASGVSMDFAVFGDGKLLYKQTAITRQTNPSAFAVDVSGVKILTIETRNLGAESEGWLLLGKAKLYPHEGEMKCLEETRLGDLVAIDAAEYESEIGLYQDALGMLHDGYLRFNAGYDSYIAWNLDGNYTTFSGKFVTGRATGANVAITVQIYGDDELLFACEEYDKTKEALEFNVDVTGKQVLKIVTDDPGEGRDAYLYLVDDLLMRAETEMVDVPEQEKEESATAWDDVNEEDNETAAEEQTADGTTEESYHFPELTQTVQRQVAAFAEYGTHRYYLFENPMSWKSAKEFCEKAGGHLVVITSPLEQARIKKLLAHALANDYWIGGTDEQEEGTFVWTNGEEMSYTNWEDGEPSNTDKGEGITEAYMEIYAYSGRWNDNDETKEFGFIMEISDDKDTVRDYQELEEMRREGKLTESNGYEYHEEIADANGKAYLSSYVLDASNHAWATYDLNGEYTKMSGVLSTYKQTEQNADMSIGFFGDGKLLYGQSGISGWAQAQPFEIDVTGVKTLTIKTDNAGDYNYGWLLLNDTTITLAQTPVSCDSTVRLKDLQVIDVTNMEYQTYLFQDTYGELHESDYSFCATVDSYALYLLGGKYTQFSGVLCAGAKTFSDNTIKVEIYADDELLFEQDGITRTTKAIPFTLDVTGKQNLKIVTSDSGEAYEGYVYLTEDSLQ